MRSLGIDIGGTSVKAALIDGNSVRTGRSPEYADPSSESLREAIAAALPGELEHVAAVGLCVPGRLDSHRTQVVQSINVPGIEKVPLADLVSAAIGRKVIPVVASDAHAAAHDFWTTHQPPGRLLAISIGTGVGASVLDDGHPLLVSGETPGHLGQIDVTLDPDLTGRTLEWYVGAKRLRADFGMGVSEAIARFHEESNPVRALARAIRIAHAIYRPDAVALLGFVGMSFELCRGELETVIRKDLTPVAKPNWQLMFGSTPFHAALGAARLASLK